MSCVMCHVSRVMCHVSRVKYHVSRVTCHMSHVMCHMSHFFFFWTKCWSLSVEGLLLTGPTPSSFSYKGNHLEMTMILFSVHCFSLKDGHVAIWLVNNNVISATKILTSFSRAAVVLWKNIFPWRALEGTARYVGQLLAPHLHFSENASVLVSKGRNKNQVIKGGT